MTDPLQWDVMEGGLVAAAAAASSISHPKAISKMKVASAAAAAPATIAQGAKKKAKRAATRQGPKVDLTLAKEAGVTTSASVQELRAAAIEIGAMHGADKVLAGPSFRASSTQESALRGYVAQLSASAPAKAHLFDSHLGMGLSWYEVKTPVDEDAVRRSFQAHRQDSLLQAGTRHSLSLVKQRDGFDWSYFVVARANDTDSASKLHDFVRHNSKLRIGDVVESPAYRSLLTSSSEYRDVLAQKFAEQLGLELKRTPVNSLKSGESMPTQFFKRTVLSQSHRRKDDDDDDDDDSENSSSSSSSSSSDSDSEICSSGGSDKKKSKSKSSVSTELDLEDDQALTSQKTQSYLFFNNMADASEARAGVMMARGPVGGFVHFAGEARTGATGQPTRAFSNRHYSAFPVESGQWTKGRSKALHRQYSDSVRQYVDDNVRWSGMLSTFHPAVDTLHGDFDAQCRRTAQRLGYDEERVTAHSMDMVCVDMAGLDPRTLSLSKTLAVARVTKARSMPVFVEHVVPALTKYWSQVVGDPSKSRLASVLDKQTDDGLYVHLPTSTLQRLHDVVQQQKQGQGHKSRSKVPKM